MQYELHVKISPFFPLVLVHKLSLWRLVMLPGLVASPVAFSLDEASRRDNRSTNRTHETRKDYLQCTVCESSSTTGVNRRGMCTSLNSLGSVVYFCQFWEVSKEVQDGLAALHILRKKGHVHSLPSILYLNALYCLSASKNPLKARETLTALLCQRVFLTDHLCRTL